MSDELKAAIEWARDGNRTVEPLEYLSNLLIIKEAYLDKLEAEEEQAAEDAKAVTRYPKAMILVYEVRLTHSVWQDYYGEDADGMNISDDELISRLKQGVINGDWVAWRLITVHREVMGIV